MLDAMLKIFENGPWWVIVIILLIPICLIVVFRQIWNIIQERNRYKNLDIGRKGKKFESHTLTESNNQSIEGIPEDTEKSHRKSQPSNQGFSDRGTAIESHKPPLDMVGQGEVPKNFRQSNQEMREPHTEIGSLEQRMRLVEEKMKNMEKRMKNETEAQQSDQRISIEREKEWDVEDIEWLKSLKRKLEESVSRFSEDLDEENWRELKERVEYLRRFLSALEEITSAMSQDDRASFAIYVDREVEKPLKQIQDLLTLREMQNDSDDPVLLLKGALVGEEVFNASSIASILRRTRPAQMIRYFLPEIDSRVTENGEKDAERVFEEMGKLGGDEVEIIGARPGDTFDTRRYQIVSQDTSGTQSRDQIVRCLAHGLKNSQTDEIELKAKVVIAV